MNPSVPGSYVLIADDDVDDIEMLTTALKEQENALDIRIADNGKNVLEQLRQTGNGNLPCILVMDMNMPRMDGRETVVAIKAHEHLKKIPIVLFSTSKNKTDELFAEKWAVRYLQKPDTVQGLNEMARSILALCRNKTELV
jgi:CheY-like chemotaxis protein